MRWTLACKPQEPGHSIGHGVSAETRKRLLALPHTGLCDAKVAGSTYRFPHRLHRREDGLRTVRPSRKGRRFLDLAIKTGEKFGVKPVGLGARDSLRTEAAPAALRTRDGLAPAKPASATWAWRGRFWRLRQDQQTLVHRREAFVAREQAVRRGLPLPVPREGCPPWPQRRSRAG